jgi:hypothetical protein
MSDNLTVKPAEQLYEYNGPLKEVVHRYKTEMVPVDKIVSMTPLSVTPKKATSRRWTTYRFVDRDGDSSKKTAETEKV